MAQQKLAQETAGKIVISPRAHFWCTIFLVVPEVNWQLLSALARAAGAREDDTRAAREPDGRESTRALLHGFTGCFTHDQAPPKRRLSCSMCLSLSACENGRRQHLVGGTRSGTWERTADADGGKRALAPIGSASQTTPSSEGNDAAADGNSASRRARRATRSRHRFPLLRGARGGGCSLHGVSRPSATLSRARSSASPTARTRHYSASKATTFGATWSTRSLAEAGDATNTLEDTDDAGRASSTRRRLLYTRATSGPRVQPRAHGRTKSCSSPACAKDGRGGLIGTTIILHMAAAPHRPTTARPKKPAKKRCTSTPREPHIHDLHTTLFTRQASIEGPGASVGGTECPPSCPRTAWGRHHFSHGKRQRNGILEQKKDVHVNRD